MSLTADISKSNLIINRLTKAQFDELDSLGQINDNEIYLVEETELNAQNKRLTNLLSGSLSSDAITVGQVNDQLKSYYKSDETSSANEIQLAINDISSGLSAYYPKSETSSSTQIADALSSVSTSLSSKSSVYITDPYYDEVSNLTSLNVVKLTRAEYANLVQTSSVLSDTIYIVSADSINAYGQVIENVATPEMSSDAVNKAYVDLLSTKYQLSGDYATKSTTLSGYGITDAKIEDGTITLGLSTITPLQSVPDEYKTYQATLSSLSADGYVMESLLNAVSTLLSTHLTNKVTMKYWDDDDPVPED